MFGRTIIVFLPLSSFFFNFENLNSPSLPRQRTTILGCLGYRLGSRVLRLGRQGVRALRLGRQGVRALRLGRQGVRALRLGRQGVRALRLGWQGGRALRLGRQVVKKSPRPICSFSRKENLTGQDVMEIFFDKKTHISIPLLA